MIFITGDTHYPIDFNKVRVFSAEHSGLTRQDYLIICGDAGFVWKPKSIEDKQALFWLSNQPYTILFVDGNHENHAVLNSMPIKIWHGGKIHKLAPNIYHLMRGQIFEIEGKTFFTMGGADSIDKYNRREGISWWPEELPNTLEYNEALDNLDKINWKVDYVLTHCVTSIVQYKICSYYISNMLTNFLKTIAEDLTFKHWYFGHYHMDQTFEGKYTCLFKNIIQLT